MGDPRSSLRIPVQFRGCFSAAPNSSAEGRIIDLSVGGCRIGTPTAVSPRRYGQLSIEVSDHEAPIIIDIAVVRWTEGGQFGIQFLNIRAKPQSRLEQLVQRITTIRQ